MPAVSTPAPTDVLVTTLPVATPPVPDPATLRTVLLTPSPYRSGVAAQLAAEGRPVHVVVPMRPTRLQAWCSDIDGAHAAALRVVHGWLDGLAAHGVRATGEVGDPDHAVALADAGAQAPTLAVLTLP
ncbi:hypothetical protein [Paraconexibacter algicola]|uniref:Uncharacterized protein n=1 Tax=Paraconexibacter algicola TaxID=2133960 RepID=A0A2T4UIZ3_9ACTN|nr:hypothetical protein [Paraconexibacter algicola]PTL59208.1 hypothetical protein C7Y72_05865 [Paraconexibacter algicola]